MHRGLIFLSAFLALKAVAAGQATGTTAAPRPPGDMAGNGGEVVFDFVARDSHSRPVSNLRPEEVRIADGGTPVKITRLQLVSAQTSSDPRLVSFVFDALDAYRRAAGIDPALHEG